jgi:hypothetical protein
MRPATQELRPLPLASNEPLVLEGEEPETLAEAKAIEAPPRGPAASFKVRLPHPAFASNLPQALTPVLVAFGIVAWAARTAGGGAAQAPHAPLRGEDASVPPLWQPLAIAGGTPTDHPNPACPAISIVPHLLHSSTYMLTVAHCRTVLSGHHPVPDATVGAGRAQDAHHKQASKHYYTTG